MLIIRRALLIYVLLMQNNILLKQRMKILSSPKSGKQNNQILSNTQNRFYPKNHRPSQMGTINDMLSLNENKCLHDSLVQSLKSSTYLNHFKKNNNLVQCNIHQDKRATNNLIKITKRRKIDYQLATLSFKRNGSIKDFHQNNSIALTSLPFHKAKKPICPFQLINKFKIYPRYKVLELYALYRSILQYSERDPQKFLQAFESALNYRKIIIKSEIVRKNLYDQKQMQFKDFLLVYKKMQDLMFIQSIIDYLEIIFEVYSLEKMSYEVVYSILAKRSEAEAALTISEIIFKKLGIEKDESIHLQQILQLCQRDIQFCSIFSKLYHQDEP